MSNVIPLKRDQDCNYNQKNLRLSDTLAYFYLFLLHLAASNLLGTPIT